MKNKLFILPLILAFAPSLYAQDYAAYNSLLKKYAKADGVKYDKFAKSSGDKKILKGILAYDRRKILNLQKRNDRYPTGCRQS